MEFRPLKRIGDEYCKEECAQIINLVNEAFMCDAFFKQADKVQRIKTEDGAAGVESLQDLLIPPATFLVCCSPPGSGEIIACVRVEVKDAERRVASLSMVSVRDAHSRRGIGSRMIKYAEEYCTQVLHCNTVELLVISLQPHLVDFYAKLGYSRPTNGDLPIPMNQGILRPEYEGLVKFILMRKSSAIN